MSDALEQPQTQLRLFGKPDINGRRRLGVVLTRRSSTEKAVDAAIESAKKIKVIY